MKCRSRTGAPWFEKSGLGTDFTMEFYAPEEHWWEQGLAHWSKHGTMGGAAYMAVALVGVPLYPDEGVEMCVRALENSDELSRKLAELEVKYTEACDAAGRFLAMYANRPGGRVPGLIMGWDMAKKDGEFTVARATCLCGNDLEVRAPGRAECPTCRSTLTFDEAGVWLRTPNP